MRNGWMKTFIPISSSYAYRIKNHLSPGQVPQAQVVKLQAFQGAHNPYVE